MGCRYNSCFNPRETMGRYYDCDKRGVGVKKVFDYMVIFSYLNSQTVTVILNSIRDTHRTYAQSVDYKEHIGKELKQILEKAWSRKFEIKIINLCLIHLFLIKL